MQSQNYTYMHTYIHIQTDIYGILKNCYHKDTKNMNNELSGSQIRHSGHCRPNLHYDTMHSNVLSISFKIKRTKLSKAFLWLGTNIQWWLTPSPDYPVLKVSQVRKLTSRGQWSSCGKRRGEEARARGKQCKDHSNFVLGPLWQMEKLTGQQSWYRGHNAPGRTVPKVLFNLRCPAWTEKHCPRLKADCQTLKLCWPPFLCKTFEKPMKPKGLWVQKTIFLELNIKLEVHQRYAVVLFLIYMTRCGSLNKLH